MIERRRQAAGDAGKRSWRRPFKRTHRGIVFRLQPPEILLLGFILFSLAGTLLLKLPIATTGPISWLDALFTSTSAVTVTGLAVVDTGSDLTLFGQAVVATWIQIGGLGFMTFAALTVMMLGGRLPMTHNSVVRESLNQPSLNAIRGLVGTVVTYALIAESIGTVLLGLHWIPEHGWRTGLWESVFHTISAFNNAGFSTHSNSLMDDVGSPLVNLTISALFIIGGIGFAVLGDLRRTRRFSQFTLQTRLILLTTLFLNLIAFAAITALEWHNPGTLGGLQSTGERLLAGWFQAVTPRTAGFNTIDTSAMTQPSTLITMALMFIGAGPSSTASGIKITTFVVLILAARAFLQQRDEPAVMHRRMSVATVNKAIAVALATGSMVFIVVLGLSITEPGASLEDILFETVSALGTVGLSRGLTGDLSTPGRLLIIVTMIVGRVGPLSLGYFMARESSPAIRYPQASLQIG
ncbi:TrkH family potassium uptake protein [Salinisphaera sp. Q1T1-3]|uniref:TrkH family potassium uptake protein n=1 Tax=Salinisphaera sp. Q1T1-3 TaxID=2321229 RepID=UPI000E75B3C6|nr:TrkH family potassium uptake protein [Salinisphaera sp. Q1T1-3]RJS94857.1 Ktr system potassium transporter B [Salinisphaera sp. Q1T1-3]